MRVVWTCFCGFLDIFRGFCQALLAQRASPSSQLASHCGEMSSDWLILGIHWELPDHNYISMVFILSWLMLIIGLNFRLWITAMEPDKLEWYMVLKDWCTDKVTENCPHYKDMYDVSLWCKGNDCSWSWAFWRSMSNKNKMVWENPWKTYEIAASSQRLAQFQAVCSLQFHSLSIPPQQRTMLCNLFLWTHLYWCLLYFLLLLRFLLQGRTGQWGKIWQIGNNFGNFASNKLGMGENCCTYLKSWMISIYSSCTLYTHLFIS